MRRTYFFALLVCGVMVLPFASVSNALVPRQVSDGSAADGIHTVSVMDFVKIKNDKRAEALYFYENNWKVYREFAMKEGYIRSFHLLKVKSEEGSDFDLILITEYASEAQFKQSEERFNAIIKATRPNGPKLLDDVKPADFRTTVFSKIAESDSP